MVEDNVEPFVGLSIAAHQLPLNAHFDQPFFDLLNDLVDQTLDLTHHAIGVANIT
jgi:hypothetical protein